MTAVLVAMGQAVTIDAPELDGFKKAGFDIKFGKSAPTTPVGDVIEYLQGCAAVVAGGEPYPEAATPNPQPGDLDPRPQDRTRGDGCHRHTDRWRQPHPATRRGVGVQAVVARTAAMRAA